MALPKIKMKKSRFSIGGMLREIEEKLAGLFSPLELSRKEEGPVYKGAPGPAEWDEEGPAENRGGPGLELAVKAKRRLPGKAPKLDSKKMHLPKRRGERDGRDKTRGRLQKHL